MIHPFVRLLATEPALVTEHLGAYASLVGRETEQVKDNLMVRLLLTILCVTCVGIAAVLAGVAVMLWAVTPGLSQQAEWALCAAPAVPAIVALLSGLYARRPSAQRAFAAVHEQIATDLRMLHELNGS
jgi:uncharacterized membrane protein YqjE